MKEITDDYVSFEIAKLLKEKGFDELCFALYNPEEELIQCGVKLSNTQVGRVPGSYSAPTHQMALKWLREVHNIFIEIKYVPNQFTDEPGYKAMIWDMSEEIGRPLPDDIEYAFYETCVNNALKYTLQNFI